MPYLDLSDGDDKTCEIDVDHTVCFSSVLLIHPNMTIQLDSHQAFMMLKKLAALFGCELSENEKNA